MQDSGLQMQQASPILAELEITLDLIKTAHTRGKNPEKDERVEAAYKKVAGYPFDKSVLVNLRGTGTALHGPPGHGKSSIFRSAAMRAAEAMGMNFIELNKSRVTPSAEELTVTPFGSARPEVFDDSYNVTERDFLFVTREMAGQTSAISIAGAPSLETHKGTGEKYTAVLPDIMFLLGQRAGAGVVVFEDLGNAIPALIPVVLGMMNQGTYGHHYLGDHMLCGCTTNLGAALDGTTSTANVGAAVATRLRNFFVQDRAVEWVQRNWRGLGRRGFDDVTGFNGFLKWNPDLIREPMPRDRRSPYANPRTLSRGAEQLRSLLYRATGGGIADDKATMLPYDAETVRVGTAAIVGQEAAERLSDYYTSLLRNALPMARGLMGAKGEAERKQAVKQINEATKSEREKDAAELLAYQIGVSAAEIAARGVRESIERFEKANRGTINAMLRENTLHELSADQISRLDFSALGGLDDAVKALEGLARLDNADIHAHAVAHLAMQVGSLLGSEFTGVDPERGRVVDDEVLSEGTREALAKAARPLRENNGRREGPEASL